MLPCHCCRRRIVIVPRKTWTILIRVVLILILVTLICLIVFYFCIYRQSLKEALFTHEINCTIGDIKNTTRSCDHQQQTTCQLILGSCVIGDEHANITLYSTWSDYDTSSGQCTIDPCWNSATEQFYVSQTLPLVYGSTEWRYGYLRRTSKLEAPIAKMIFILLAATLALWLLLAVVLILILHVYNKWERRVFPVNASNPNPSIYSRPPTVIVQKPSQLTKAKQSRRQSKVESSASLQRLAVPPETILPATYEYQPRESLWKRTLQPLQISTLSGVVATLREHQRNAAATTN